MSSNRPPAGSRISASIPFSPFKSLLSPSFWVIYFSLSVSLEFADAQNGPTNWTVTPFNPPSMPLAVKSPYVNAWAPLGNVPAPLNVAWPRIWTREIPTDVSRPRAYYHPLLLIFL